MIEALLLTGGRSERMGTDKATLAVDGEPQADRIVRLLTEAGIRSTAAGKAPVSGAAFLPDDETVRSPLHAIRRFKPQADFVLVLSCDLPRFDARLATVLAERIGSAEAAVPFVDGFRQPLVALYRASAFGRLPERGCPMGWLEGLEIVLVEEEALVATGVHPDATRGANTPEEFETLTGARP